MKNIIEATEIPENEKVYLKKDFLGWRVVNPIKNEDGKINWFNLLVGGKRGSTILIVIIIIGLGLYVGVQELIGDYKLVAASPCDYCSTCHAAVDAAIKTVGSLNNQIPPVKLPLIR